MFPVLFLLVPDVQLFTLFPIIWCTNCTFAFSHLATTLYYFLLADTQQMSAHCKHSPLMWLAELLHQAHIQKCPFCVLSVQSLVCMLMQAKGYNHSINLPVQVASGGVVRDPKVHQQVLESVSSGIAALGFTNEGSIESPIKGATGGNIEFLAVFKKQ